MIILPYSDVMRIQPCNTSKSIYFTLERHRLIEERKKKVGGNDSNKADSSAATAGGVATGNQKSTAPAAPTGYENMNMPPLPPRYEHLASILPSNWFLPGKHRGVKRKHKASHGCELLLI